MPVFVYDSNSSVNYFDYNKGRFHYLTIVLSNCIYNGSVFIADIENLESTISTQFKNITNLEFRGVGCSMMRGDTDSLTIGVSAGYYSDLANLTALEATSLRVASNNAISNVSGLTVSEVRVESTLQQIMSF
jgi:hypothetical protein